MPRPAKFAYVAPASAAEALDALERHGEEARLLAGGQSLVPMMNLRVARPSVIIDLNRCKDLFYLREENAWLVAGAMHRQAAAEHDAVVRERCPLLYKALPYVGAPSNRVRGTLGGSFAHADPGAELPGVAVALDAVFVVRSRRAQREIPASEFFTGALTNSMAPGEMLCEIRIPVAPPGARAAFVESGNRRHDLAIAGIAAQATLGPDGRCRKASLAAIGVGERPMRLRRAESVLEGAVLEIKTLQRAAEAAVSEIEPQSDTVASADYRRKLVAALLPRALQQIHAATES